MQEEADRLRLAGVPAPRIDDRFRLLLEGAKEYAAFLMDPQRRITFWGESEERIFGWTAKEALGRSGDTIFTSEDRAAGAPEREQEAALRDGRAADDRWHLKQDGSRFFGSGFMVPLHDPDTGALRGFGKVLRDITARKRAQEALRQNAQLLSHLLRNLPGGSLNVFDRDLRYLFAEGRGLEAVGLASDGLVGRTLAEVFPPESVAYVTPFYERALAGETVELELAVGGRWYTVHAAPLRDAEERIDAVIALAQDITERKRAHEVLEAQVAQRTVALRDLARRLVNAQEEERARLSRELHDQTGQHLTGFMLGLNALRTTLPEGSSCLHQIERLQQVATDLSREVHLLAWDLRPPALDDLGLHATLESYLQEWEGRTGILADLHARGLDRERFPDDVRTTLYRIVQEALANVARHSGATRVSLVLERRDRLATLVIEDNGRGFDVEAALAGTRRLGLRGMHERAELLGGTLEVESAPGEGSTLFVRIPLDGETNAGT